jgi:hypothetical protein
VGYGDLEVKHPNTRHFLVFFILYCVCVFAMAMQNLIDSYEEVTRFRSRVAVAEAIEKNRRASRSIHHQSGTGTGEHRSLGVFGSGSGKHNNANPQAQRSSGSRCPSENNSGKENRGLVPDASEAKRTAVASSSKHRSDIQSIRDLLKGKEKLDCKEFIIEALLMSPKEVASDVNGDDDDDAEGDAYGGGDGASSANDHSNNNSNSNNNNGNGKNREKSGKDSIEPILRFLGRLTVDADGLIDRTELGRYHAQVISSARSRLRSTSHSAVASKSPTYSDLALVDKKDTKCALAAHSLESFGIHSRTSCGGSQKLRGATGGPPFKGLRDSPRRSTGMRKHTRVAPDQSGAPNANAITTADAGASGNISATASASAKGRTNNGVVTGSGGDAGDASPNTNTAIGAKAESQEVRAPSAAGSAR